MPEEIKGIVKPPYEMPPEKLERQDAPVGGNLPPMVRMFTWICFARAGLDFLFAFILGVAPDSAISVYLATTFGSRFAHIPAEVMFLIFGFLFAFIGWRWYARDWRARWIAMFLSGAAAARTMILIVADKLPSDHGQVLSVDMQMELIANVGLNLLICGYLAFYPGMAQAFKETPWD